MEDDQNNVRMPMGDRGHVAVMDYRDEDEIRRGENDDMDDLGEDESDDDDDDDDDDGNNYYGNDESVHKFIRTFHNGDYDQEFDDALSSDRSAVVPNTRPTQASYNKPDNWVERNRIGLEKVKEQLQNCIDHRDKNVNLKFILTHNDSHDELLIDNEEPIVWHEPILDEYWHRLEAEIDRRKPLDIVTEDIYSIYIENVEIKKERLAALVAIFRSGRATNSGTSITFDNTNLCGKGIVYLSKLVDIKYELQNFYLNHNRIDSMESARCLSMSLRSHSSIQEIRLTHCDLGSSPEMLSVILQSDVRRIDLENNNIDSLGAVKIAEYLEGDPPIQRIYLGHNQLNDDDVILISQALKRNTNLTEIYLYSNNLTSIGVKALLTCVFDSSSLNAISESNHTVTEMRIFSWYNKSINRLEYCIDGMLELHRRTQKIVIALQDKDSLLNYLANVPVELIPEVLAFPLRQADDQPLHTHLNILYSTMRWWNMPMLYSYHHCAQSAAKRKRDNE